MNSESKRVERAGLRYAEHPGVAMEAAAIERLKSRTGRTLEEWIRLVLDTGPPVEKERAAWLRAEHGLGTNYAAWVASHASGTASAYDPDGLVERMFAGSKAGLRPIYERLLELALGLGDDVTITPCATIVPIRRRYVIAQIKPSTRTRIDLGLALGKLDPATLPPRLISTGGREKRDRITERIAIAEPAAIDAEVERWLDVAYDLDA